MLIVTVGFLLLPAILNTLPGRELCLGPFDRQIPCVREETSVGLNSELGDVNAEEDEIIAIKENEEKLSQLYNLPEEEAKSRQFRRPWRVYFCNRYPQRCNKEGNRSIVTSLLEDQLEVLYEQQEAESPVIQNIEENLSHIYNGDLDRGRPWLLYSRFHCKRNPSRC